MREAKSVFGGTLALLVLFASQAASQGVVPTPTVQVRVVDQAGLPVRTGKIAIDRLNRWAFIERGTATIADLAAGRYLVSIRVAGFHPESLTVEASVTPATAPLVKLRPTGEVVIEQPDTITFIPTSHDSTVLREIGERLKIAHGTFLRYDDAAVRTAERATDALRSAKGFRWNSVNTIRTSNGCVTLPRADTLARRGTRTIAIYVDGTRTASAIETVNRMVPPRDILAIEAYPDILTAPFRWRSTDACAVVAFWTKR